MVERRVYDDEKHIHFVTFSCFRHRKHLQHDQAKQIVIGELGSRLAKHRGLCLGFVIMPDHVHPLVWFPEIQQLSSFMNKWKEMTSKNLKKVLPPGARVRITFQIVCHCWLDQQCELWCPLLLTLFFSLIVGCKNCALGFFGNLWDKLLRLISWNVQMGDEVGGRQPIGSWKIDFFCVGEYRYRVELWFCSIKMFLRGTAGVGF